MKTMTPEDYLMQVKNIDLRIRTLQGELHDAESEEDTEYAEELRKHIKADIEKHKEIMRMVNRVIKQLNEVMIKQEGKSTNTNWITLN